jgi:GNAT superfamily N-acetyltransferase
MAIALSTTVEPTTVGDIDRILRLESATDTAEWLSPTGRDWHEAALADPNQEHLLLLEDGVLAGYAVLAGVEAGGDIELRRMVVDPARRGRGLGRFFIRHLVEYAQQKYACRGMWLDMKCHNARARTLYASEGFTSFVPARDGKLGRSYMRRRF